MAYCLPSNVAANQHLTIVLESHSRPWIVSVLIDYRSLTLLTVFPCLLVLSITLVMKIISEVEKYKSRNVEELKLIAKVDV